ncbi:usherin-like isoform X2 [Oscarella lobularis]|uniref:usherin-like isoform X2 n=1 Tax=Oscarella lobularis TaxID=121494 RepID=UPI00331399D6
MTASSGVNESWPSIDGSSDRIRDLRRHHPGPVPAATQTGHTRRRCRRFLFRRNAASGCTMIIQIALIALLWCCKEIQSSTLTVCNGALFPFEDIKCGSDIIAITSATFEKVRSCYKTTAVSPPCNSSSASDIVKTACQSKSYCRLRASEVAFGTMCSGTMFLSVSYTCDSGLNGDRYLRPLKVTKSSVQLEWQKHSQENSNTKYVIERRYVAASQPSAVAGLSFDGFGYVNFSNDPFDGGKKFKTKLSFRTSAPNGLLFSAFKSDWSSYTYLQLTNGKLKFAVKGAKGSVDISAVALLSDGQFHAVEAEKKESDEDTLELTVDGIVASADDNDGSDIDVNVDSVYLGGMSSTQYVKAGVFSQKDQFVGCINVEQLQEDKKIDLLKKQGHENVRWSADGCPPAIQNGMHFRGTGYAKLTLSSSSNSQLQFGFRMRTSWPNGLLLAAYSNDNLNFFFVETRFDGFDLRYKKGGYSWDGPFLFRVRPKTTSLCDGAWHTVTVAIDTRSLVVTVDGVAYSTSSEITDIKTYSSEIMENFYLGGMESIGRSPTMVELALGYGVNVTSYGGCLADFRVNGQLVDFVEKRSSSLNVSFAGCPDFTWDGPTCVDQVLHVGSKGKGGESLTDNNGVQAFTEYLYRVTVESESGAIVPSKWIVVRTGEDESSSGPTPVLEYDSRTGEGTFRWTGPPAIVKDYTSYEIKYAEVYPASTVQSSDLTFDDDIQDASLPHTSFLSPSTTYVFSITASLRKGSVTSSYARITTTGRECRRSLYRGTYYRGTTSVSEDGRSCLNWSELSTYSNLVALYPESGLGNHSYCRNPLNRTMPWCYTNDTGGCLNWTYCDIDECEDTMCYSSLDNGNGYRGSSTNASCVSWSHNSALSVPENAAAGLGDHSYCRNPYPQTRSKPWCYESGGGIRDCAIDKCTKDVPTVKYVCGGDSDGKDECVFPFIYKGKRFYECTSFNRDAPWCSISNNRSLIMKEWAYCLCPKPSISLSLPTYSPPVSGRIDGTCLALSTTAAPTTVAPSTVTPTTVSSDLPTTSTASAATTFSPTTSSDSPSTTRLILQKPLLHLRFYRPRPQ